MGKGHTTIVVDALWGDSGKGKISAYIAKKEDYDIAVRAGTGTNAGHSIHVYDKMIKTNQLPVAGILKNDSGKQMLLAVGSGVCVDPLKLHREILDYNLSERVLVDYRCPTILETHKEREGSGDNYSEKHTGSTKSGTGEARVDIVRRTAKRIGDIPMSESIVGDVAKLVNQSYDDGKKIVVEGSQSHYLSLYLSPEYPVVTSDNCTSTAFADDVGLSWDRIDDVCMVIKSAPTRVSQNCGDLPGEISEEKMRELDICEWGVTTGRLRRKSLDIPFEFLDDVFMINSPTFVALTFCDHIESIPEEVPDEVSLDWIATHMPKTYDNISEIENKYGIPVRYIEYGKDFNFISKVIS
jgi:adenylosuccinate synthase